MRILCYSKSGDVSLSTARLVAEWTAITGDSVMLARTRADTAVPEWRPVDVERGRLTAPRDGRISSLDETSSDTVHVKTIDPVPTPTAAALATVASRASTRMIVIDAPISNGEAADHIVRFAEAVAENSPVPTLVVRDADNLRQWLRGSRTFHVYCAHGFSETSDAALRAVKDLQDLAACSVTVGHVGLLSDERVRLGIRGPIDLDGGDPEVERILARDLRERIDDVMGIDAGVEVDISSTWGRPDFQILARAKKVNADLLVVGTHQWRGVHRVLHPSVSRAAIRHAAMNLLVVPRAERIEAAEIRSPQRILVATDFTEAGDLAVRHAYALAQPDSILRLLHVVHPRALGGGEFVQRITDSRTQERHLDYLRRCALRLRSLVRDDVLSRGIISEAAVLEHATPADAIVEEGERFGADVICLGTHGRTGLSAGMVKPVAQRILARSHRPVFLARPPER